MEQEVVATLAFIEFASSVSVGLMQHLHVQGKKNGMRVHAMVSPCCRVSI